MRITILSIWILMNEWNNIYGFRSTKHRVSGSPDSWISNSMYDSNSHPYFINNSHQRRVLLSTATNTIEYTSIEKSQLNSILSIFVTSKSLSFASIFLLSSLSGLFSALVVNHGRSVVSKLDSYRLLYPSLFPVLGGFALSILLFLQHDLNLNPSNLFNHNNVNNSNKSSDITVSVFSLKRQLLRFLGVLIVAGSGIAIGIAGPMAEIGMTVAKVLSIVWLRILSKWNLKQYIDDYSLDTILLAGSAAGLAANFDTPIAGTAFALEFTSRMAPNRVFEDYKEKQQSRSFRSTAVLLASILSATVVRKGSLVSFTKHVYGKYLPSITPSFSSSSTFSSITIASIHNWLALVTLGILSGTLGSAFNIVWYNDKIRNKFHFLPRIFRPMIGALISALSVIMIGESQALPDGFKYIDRVLSISSIASITKIGSNSLSSITSFQNSLKYLIMKYFATGVSIASGTIGGMVGPALFLGSALAQVLSSISYFQCGNIPIFIAAGSSAILASIFRMPITACLLLIEMSGSVNIAGSVIFTTMISSATTNLIDLLQSQSESQSKPKSK